MAVSGSHKSNDSKPIVGRSVALIAKQVTCRSPGRVEVPTSGGAVLSFVYGRPSRISLSEKDWKILEANNLLNVYSVKKGAK